MAKAKQKNHQMATALPKRKRGRPSTYSKEIADEVVKRIAEGEGMRAICADIGCSPGSVIGWVTSNIEDFSERYAQACISRANLWAEEIISIADCNVEDPQRSRLMVDTRKWLLAKVLPKLYGDKLQTQISGPDGGPVESNVKIIIEGV